MLSIIKNNIKVAWNNKKSFVLIVILAQVFIAFSILFVTGAMASDYMSLKEDMNGNMIATYNIIEPDNSKVLFRDIEPMLFEIDKKFGSVYDGIHVSFNTDMADTENIYFLFARLGIKDGKYTLNHVWEGPIKYCLKEGRIFTVDDMNSDECLGVFQADELFSEDVEIKKQDEIIIDGISVKNVGKIESITPEINLNPAAARKITIPVKDCSLILNRILTEDENAELCRIIDKYIAKKYTCNLSTYSSADRKSILRSSMTTSVITGMAGVVVLMIIYSYFFDIKRKNYAIIQLSGCSRAKATAILLGEMMIISIPSLSLGMLIYYICQVKWLNNYFLYLKIAMTREVYKIFFVAFFIVVFIVCLMLSFIYSRKSIKSQLVAAGR